MEQMTKVLSSYVVPLKRDMTADETFVIVSAWEYKYMPDFNIEISNMYDTMQDFEIDIDEDVKQQAIFDLNKWHHNRWRDEMLREGWHYGLYFSSKNKSHPALKDWTLPESKRSHNLLIKKYSSLRKICA